MRRPKNYTIIGIYNDNGQPFVDVVSATTPRGALRKGETAMAENAACGGRVISIIEGEHMDVCPAIADRAA